MRDLPVQDTGRQASTIAQACPLGASWRLLNQGKQTVGPAQQIALFGIGKSHPIEARFHQPNFLRQGCNALARIGQLACAVEGLESVLKPRQALLAEG